MDTKPNDPYDMNSPSFNPDLFLQRTFKECSLKQIMNLENEMVRDTAALHSDMQTLVYENYNKFISATDTVRKMKSDFKHMEAEMELLSENMNSITSFSEQISKTLQNSRAKISKLSSVHSLLERLQFLFKLPSNLKLKMEEKAYSEAVDDYLHAEKVLEQYGHMPSFLGIKNDCEAILSELKEKLREQITNDDPSSEQLAQSVDLLLKLQEPPEDLCSQYLSHCDKKLVAEIETLKKYVHEDLIDFIDCVSNGFLSNLWLMVQSFNDMFLNRPYSAHLEDLDTIALKQLHEFVNSNMDKYFVLVQDQFEKEQDSGDTIILVRALDRFHRRLQAMNTLIQGSNFISVGVEIIIRAGRRQCRAHLQNLKAHFTDHLTRMRQSLASVKTMNQDTDNNSNLTELFNSMIVATVEKLKGVLQDLLVFLQPDLTFGVNTKFQEVFCVDSIREGLVVGFLHHLTATARSFCENQGAPATLLLVLSKFCLELQQNHVHSLLSQTDEWFNMDEKPGSDLLTSESEVSASMREAAQNLLNHYVRTQGLSVSQMLRKSVETRDWLHTIEPRTVRAVMKRVVEDIASIETQVGVLYEEGQRSERSSDSSRKTGAYSVSQLSRHRAYRSNWSSYAPGQSSLGTNIHKLFSERIEIFSSVEFSKVSILTGIIKISLKTLLECVRLRTFSRYGLQQIQVDTHYLQLYLWRFVTDENLVHFLLDEILDSAVHRCLDPVLMEPSVVDIICERG